MSTTKRVATRRSLRRTPWSSFPLIDEFSKLPPPRVLTCLGWIVIDPTCKPEREPIDIASLRNPSLPWLDQQVRGVGQPNIVHRLLQHLEPLEYLPTPEQGIETVGFH